MPTMNISLPQKMKEWVDAQLEAGEYYNGSEYIRDLIRRDQEARRQQKAFQEAIHYGRASSDGSRTLDAIMEDAREKQKQDKKRSKASK